MGFSENSFAIHILNPQRNYKIAFQHSKMSGVRKRALSATFCPDWKLVHWNSEQRCQSVMVCPSHFSGTRKYNAHQGIKGQQKLLVVTKDAHSRFYVTECMNWYIRVISK